MAEAVFFDHDSAAFANDEFRIFNFKVMAWSSVCDEGSTAVCPQGGV
jgi:hypothetical protein